MPLALGVLAPFLQRKAEAAEPARPNRPPRVLDRPDRSGWLEVDD
jgi:hypothetical protein